MALLSPQQVQITGTAATYAAAAVAGDSVRPDDRTFLHVKNASAGAVTVTVVVPGEQFGQPLADVPVSVPAGGERLIGPLVRSLAGSSDVVDITYSAVTSVTVAAIRV